MFKLVQVFICVGFIVISGFCQAQKSLLIGGLKDQQTKRSIPYAHIIFTETKYGTTSNDQGRFLLEVDSTLLNENVRISCIGYQSKILPSHELSNQTIYLSPKIERLNEVALFDHMDKMHCITLNPFRGKQGVVLSNFSGGAYSSVLAGYDPNGYGPVFRGV